MPRALTVWLLLLASGCTYITNGELDARLDLDDDSVPNAIDCDKTDASVGAAQTWYVDADADGYGDDTSGVTTCDPEPGWVTQAGDCNDANDSVNPGAAEVCNEVDDDCDDAVDDGAPEPTWYLDDDGDGYGDPAVSFTTCFAPSQAVDNDGDCDDDDASVHPGTQEVCDGIDNDCDGDVDDDDDSNQGNTWYLDADGDGHGTPDVPLATADCTQPPGYVALDDDCDDAEFAVHGAAPELCNGVDDDCDSLLDDQDPDALALPRWYDDTDGDGFGDPATAVLACIAPAGTTSEGGDCDDADVTVRPGAPEVCNAIDDDCDGIADDSAIDPLVFFADTDSDGFGDAGAPQLSCTAPAGHVADDTDCDDTTGLANPDADELCDGIDNNCDGVTDEREALDATEFYLDADADGYGTAAVAILGCTPPPGYASLSTDCDDSLALVYPGAPELCDGIDNDCDGDASEGQLTATWYADADGDGYGDVTASLPDVLLGSCEAPTGYVLDDSDCDDTNAQRNPGEPEVCNGIDDDCDEDIDDADASAMPPTWYTDGDGDGFGQDAASVTSCVQPGGTADLAGDCDDSNAAVNPSANEVCNTLDDDCDGAIDDDDLGVLDPEEWFVDSDGDGFGDPLFSTLACTAPGGTVPDDTDCDDGAPGVNPDGVEACNGADDDCDGLADEDDAIDAVVWYADADNDGYGNPNQTVTACLQPTGFLPDSSDCDDTSNQSFPGAIEQCDSRDNDCDGTVDDNVSATTWFADNDGDGFGTSSPTIDACARPDGFAASSGDCDDTVASVHPDASEQCDGVDNDCDSLIDDNDDDVKPLFWFLDSDQDGFGDEMSISAACNQPAGSVADPGDCDDTDGAVSPAATEICNGIDDDCDFLIDDADSSVSDRTTWYRDADGDGAGVDASALAACNAPGGFVAASGDCDDTVDTIHPGASEQCNGVDDDCDGTTDGFDSIDASTWYLDQDGDGFGDSTSNLLACSAPVDFVADDTDCDDNDPFTWPGAPELCDLIDNDCDLTADNNVVDVTWFLDSDGDGFGDSSQTLDQCDQPVGYVADDTDCDDSVGTTFPGAPEVCNSTDDDCDGKTDAADTDVTDASAFYPDDDADGFGDATAPELVACSAPAGWVADNTDCDDDDDTLNPAVAEVCDGDDDDCDGLVDAADPSLIDGTTWYDDADGDTYGDDATAIVSCANEPGVTTGGDCDDTNNAVNPSQAEICNNGLDDNCDASASPCTDGFDGTFALDDAGVHALFGADVNDNLGHSLSDPGDVDGSATADVLIGAPYAADESGTGDRTGAVWIVLSQVSASDSVESVGIPIWGTEADARFGWAHDGGMLDAGLSVDLVVGAPLAGGKGEATVFIDGFDAGAADRDDATFVFTGEDDDDEAGYSIAMAGDVNDDGVLDILVGAPGHDSASALDVGAAYLLDGASLASGSLGNAEARLEGFWNDDAGGWAVAALGDTDGDGIDDILATSPRFGLGAVPRRGHSYLFRGPISGNLALRGDHDSLFQGQRADNQAGRAVANAGDVDGDGIDDILIGAPFFDLPAASTGAAYLLLAPHPAFRALGAANARIDGLNGGDEFGSAIAGLGDTDADTFGDFAISAPFHGSTGRTYIFRGPISGFRSASVAAATYDGYHDSQHAGWALVAPGDMNGDGLGDLVIGANWDDGMAEKGGGAYFILAPAGL